MKILHFSFVILVAFCIFLQQSYCKKDNSNKSEFGVIITTIPSRQVTIAHSIRTWLSQAPLGVKKIVICIPNTYKNYELYNII